jgi:PAS domain S-box-containing protein
MEAVVNSLNDAIILVDEKMLVVSANKVALELTGLKEPDIIGKYAPDIAMRNDLFREIIKGVVSLDSNEKPEDTLQIVYDQKDSFFQKDIREIKLEEHGHIEDIGHAFILKNITSFEERDTAKTNLIATVSHELKTPLSSINLSIKLLEDNRLGDLNDSQKKILITVKQQTARLSKMVNELLDFSQAESGNIKLSMEKVKPEDIVDYAITALMIMAAEKKVDLDTQINGDLPYVKADIEKTVWVLSNLISNAIRYTPENGSITMKCDEDKDFVRFSVIDHGPGIAKDNLGKVFDKFVQIGNNPKGRGLGLTIAKEFVISQGGDIWVESEVGVGSVFTFKLLKYKA